MTDIEKDIEAKQILRDVAQETHAIGVLRKPGRPYLLVSLMVNAIALYVVLTGLQASLGVKMLLVITCGAAVTSAFEIQRLTRRLDAVTTLLLKRIESR